MPIPSYLPYSEVGACIGVIIALLVGLHSALSRANWPPSDRASALGRAAFILIGWFALTLALVKAGAYRGIGNRIPTIQFGVLLPVAVGAGLIWRSRSFGRLLDAVPRPWLIGVQFYRVLGVTFLTLHAAGALPGAFAWPAGVGDMLVGLMAPVVAVGYARKPWENPGRVLSWNVLGLIDLAVALSLGFLTSPSPLQALSFDAPNTMIGSFPLILIPVFLVPLAILLHLASLRGLRADRASSREAPPRS